MKSEEEITVERPLLPLNTIELEELCKGLVEDIEKFGNHFDGIIFFLENMYQCLDHNLITITRLEGSSPDKPWNTVLRKLNTAFESANDEICLKMIDLKESIYVFIQNSVTIRSENDPLKTKFQISYEEARAHLSTPASQLIKYVPQKLDSLQGLDHEIVDLIEASSIVYIIDSYFIKTEASLIDQDPSALLLSHIANSPLEIDTKDTAAELKVLSYQREKKVGCTCKETDDPNCMIARYVSSLEHPSISFEVRLVKPTPSKKEREHHPMQFHGRFIIAKRGEQTLSSWYLEKGVTLFLELKKDQYSDLKRFDVIFSRVNRSTVKRLLKHFPSENNLNKSSVYIHRSSTSEVG